MPVVPLVNSNVPPDETVTVPPATIVAPMAVPPLNTISVPPLETVVSLAVPPASTTWEPVKIIAPLASAIIELPAAGNMRAIICAVGADDLAAAAEDRRRISEPAGQNIERAAARHRRVAGGAARRHDLRAAVAQSVLETMPPDRTFNLTPLLTVKPLRL